MAKSTTNASALCTILRRLTTSNADPTSSTATIQKMTVAKSIKKYTSVLYSDSSFSLIWEINLVQVPGSTLCYLYCIMQSAPKAHSPDSCQILAKRLTSDKGKYIYPLRTSPLSML